MQRPAGHQLPCSEASTLFPETGTLTELVARLEASKPHWPPCLHLPQHRATAVEPRLFFVGGSGSLIVFNMGTRI